MKKVFKSSLALALVLASSSSVIADTTPAPSVSQQYVKTGGDIREVKETISNLQAQLNKGNLTQQDINNLASELSALNKEVELQDVSNNQDIKDIFNDATKLVNSIKDKGNIDTTKVDTQLLILNNKLVDTVDAVSTPAPGVARVREKVATPSRGGTTARQVKSFSDVKEGSWYYKAVTSLANRGGIAGYNDGTFKPNGTITFSEFLKMSMSSATGKDYAPTPGGHWASGVHKAAVEMGIIDGREFAGTNEVLNKVITREDMTLILVNINEKIQKENKVDTSNTASKISDINKVSPTRRTFVLQAYEKSLISGKDNNNFDPQNSTTRAEAATVIMRMLDMDFRVPIEDTKPVEQGRVIDLSDPNRNIRVREGDTVALSNGVKLVVTMGRDYLGQGQGIDFYQNAIGFDGKAIKPGSTGISVYTTDVVSPELIAKYKATGAVLPNTLTGGYVKLKNGDYMVSDIKGIINQAYFMDLPDIGTQKIGDVSPCGYYKVVPHEAGGGRGVWEMQL